MLDNLNFLIVYNDDQDSYIHLQVLIQVLIKQTIRYYFHIDNRLHFLCAFKCGNLS